MAFRADRKSRTMRSGGVFILVQDNLRCTKVIDFQTECELLWVKLEVLFVCVEVLRPSQPNGVMSSAVSLLNHTFTGQA